MHPQATADLDCTAANNPMPTGALMSLFDAFIECSGLLEQSKQFS
jgi:hypothetical protein